jgi:putative DNA primase/helicase
LRSQSNLQRRNRRKKDQPAFNRRIADVLALQPPINERGELEPPLLTLSSDAKAAWIRFYDHVETELGTSGELVDIRDVASKAADNVARLAAVLHVVESGASGSISATHLIAACRLVAWHLTEARRFLGEFSLPPALPMQLA